MSNPNVTLVQSLYAAFGRGDIATIIAGLAPDVHWHVNGRSTDFPAIGVWRGAAEVQKFFQIVGENEEFSEFTPQEFYAVDDKVFALGRYAGTIRKTGRKIASDWLHVFTVKGGKVTGFKEFNDTAQFAEAFRG